MKAYGLGLIPYFPLAGGMLTGKYKRGAPPPPGVRLASSKGMASRYLTDRAFDIVEALQAFVQARGKTILDLAFAWLLARAPVASVIAGATKPEQVEQNVRAAGWKLDADDLAAIDKIARPE
jgi:aryl-alcohol dehydrogenase-like predicted oxidoreductase